MRDGWAAQVGRPDRRLRPVLCRVLPVGAVLVALGLGTAVLWPRTEGAQSQTPPASVAAEADPEATEAMPEAPGGSPASTDPATSSTAAPPTDPVAPAAPPAADDPGAVLAFGRAQGLVLVQPAILPVGWRADGAEVVPGADTPEGCEQAGLYWLDPVDADFGFLDTYQFPAACAAPRPEAAEVFRAGLHAGWIVPDERAGWHVELVVGSTLVQVWSDLAPADLVEVLSQLVPYDPGQPPAFTHALPPR